ncbi:MAG: DUF1592 domain-containing protein [Polyangiales bacterium]
MLSAALAGLALGACSGEITQGKASGRGGPSASGNGSGPGGASTPGSTTPGAGPGSGSDPADPRIAQRIWRLSPDEFNAEITRLFGTGAPAVEIPETAAEDGITNIAANAVVDMGNASVFNDGARAIASWVVAQKNTTTRCTNYGTPACVDSFLAWFPQAAFRRTLTSTEIPDLRNLFDNLRATYDYDYAFGGIVRSVLLSPDFLYRTELGGKTPTVLAPSEIANLLAFSITNQSPDAELLKAAETGDLTNPDQREAQARRLMANSASAWQSFFWQWLQMDTLYSQAQEVGLDPTLATDMEEEFRTFVREVVVTQHGTLRDLLSAPYTWAQPELAQFYGAAHPGSGLAKVQLDEAQRGGILTQGAWLVSHGKKGRDNVVRRGMGLYRQAMCHNDLKPPAGVDVQAELKKLVGPDASVREIVDARGNAPACGGCHRMADPEGMVFESFGSNGQWQTTDTIGLPVDTNVDVSGLGMFSNAHAYSTALADDLTFQSCFVQRFTHFLVGVDLGSPDMVAWTQQAHEKLMATGTSLEEMLVAIVRHPAFIERRMEAGP